MNEFESEGTVALLEPPVHGVKPARPAYGDLARELDVYVGTGPRGRQYKQEGGE